MTEKSYIPFPGPYNYIFTEAKSIIVILYIIFLEIRLAQSLFLLQYCRSYLLDSKRKSSHCLLKTAEFCLTFHLSDRN